MPQEPYLGPPPDQPDADLNPPEPFLDFGQETRQKVEGADEAVPIEEQLTELTDEERTWFSTLLTVGRRSKVIEVMGHTLLVQNLNTDDDLRVGLFCRDYQGAPPADARAYQLAVCAAGIRTIDGLPVYQSLTEDVGDEEMFTQKITRLRQYYPVVLTKIYHEILNLDRDFVELATKLGKLEG